MFVRKGYGQSSVSLWAAFSRHAGSFFKRFSNGFFEVMGIGTGKSMMIFKGNHLLGAAKRTGRNPLLTLKPDR
jgi:hypothetical protein